MVNTLYLSIDGMTDPLGQSQVLPYLAGISAAGYGVTLISCEKPDRFEAHREMIAEICTEHHIDWRPVRYDSRLPLLSSIGNIRRIRKLAFKLHREKDFKLVHCRSYLPMFTGMAMKKKLGVKLLFDIRGFWPDERVDGGLWDLGHPLWKKIYRYFKKKEKEFFIEADHVITLTHAAKREINSWKLKSGDLPVDVIPCCADLDLFNYENIRPEERRKLLHELNLHEEDDIITYLGSLGTFYAIEDMLEYFKEFKRVRPKGKFLIITASPPDIVWDAAQKMNMDPCDIRVTRTSRQGVPVHLSLGRYSLVFYRENFSRKGCSPTKLGELMGLGIPAVCSPNVGDTSEIVTEARAGMALQDLDRDTYRVAVKSMEEFPGEPAHIRCSAFRYFDLEDGIRHYISVYHKLTD